MDLLMRSNGSTHQRRQTSAGKLRANTTAGIYAKAIAVRASREDASKLAISLAEVSTDIRNWTLFDIQNWTVWPARFVSAKFRSEQLVQVVHRRAPRAAQRPS